MYYLVRVSMKRTDKARLPRKKKRLVPTGYKLHAMRLAYSGGDATRTIKYPLVPFSDKAESSFEKFVKNVRIDSVAMMGDLQFSDWIKNEAADAHPYSLADFYLDSLRAGVIFAPDKERAIQDVLAVYTSGGKRAEFEETFSKKYPKLTAWVDMDVIYKFFFSDSRTKTNKIFKQETPKTILDEFLSLFESWRVKGVDKKAKVSQFLGIESKQSAYEYPTIVAPDLPFRLGESAITLVERYKQFVQQHGAYTQYKEKNLTAILGLFNKQAALSNYFNEVLNDLRNGGDGFYRANLIAIPAWQGREDELRERIALLVKSARKLPAPALDKNWHEYRTSFGGKVDSWVSNMLRQKREIQEQLFGTGEKEHLSHVAQLEKVTTDTNLGHEVQESARLCLMIIEKLRDELSDTSLILYQDQLAALRTELNEIYQHRFSENPGKSKKERDAWDKKHRANGVYTPLYQNIKLIPEFPGDAKRVKYRKLILAPKQVKAAVVYLNKAAVHLEGTMQASDANDEHLLKVLETLRRKFFMLNGSRAKDRVRAVLGAYPLKKDNAPVSLDNILDKENENYYFFYRSFHARSNFGREITIANNLDAGDELARIVNAIAPHWDDIIAVGDVGDLLDACELEKIRFGILAKYAEIGDYVLALDKLPQEMFEKAHAFQRVIGNRPAKLREYGRFLQTTVLSELKGALTKMSRTMYTERYTVQTIASHEKYPLARAGKIWGIALDKQVGKGAVSIDVLEKRKRKDFSKEAFEQIQQDEAKLLAIRSSKYQIQFLDKALSGEKSWWQNKHSIAVSNGEYSFIVEVPIKITWDLERETVRVEEDKGDEKETRLFVSIPFSLSPQKKDSQLALGKRMRYMGIDVGEFGLAWTVLELREGAPQVLGHGFIYERLTRNIRDFVQTLKTRQSLGTFGMPSTKLERLRENAITSLRNQVHAMAMRYDATPVYEFEISAFETGGNRVRAIYDSVKRADTGRGGNEAEKMEARLVWGEWKGKGNAGKQISAYATSYLCSKCLHSLYDQTPREAWGIEKKMTRPSLKDLRNIREGQFDISADWEDTRGNSAIYICTKCGNISDADMQASYWIALKRALRDVEYGEQTIESDEKKSIALDDLREAHRRNPIVISLKSDGKVKYASTSSI
ncbi:MAG: type V CRISPR-associated protein Cas12d/CasY [Minisyncoccia bacterium]